MDDTHISLEFCCRFRADGVIDTVSPEFGPLVPVGSNLFDAVVSADRERLLQAVTTPDAAGTRFDIRVRDERGHIGVFAVEVSFGTDDPAPTAAAPDPEGLASFVLLGQEVTDLRRVGAVLHAHREVLDQIATGAPIATGLDAVARMFEVVTPTSVVAVYLRRGDVLELAAAPLASAAFVQAAGRVEHEVGVPVPGTIEPIAGGLAATVDRTGLGFGWWRSVLDEDGDDVGRIVLLNPEKRFLTADERFLLDEASRLVSVASGTARAARRAFDADARDPLTGLLHRRAFLGVIAADVVGAVNDPALVVAMVRIAGLDSVNAQHGFDAGDAVLAATAEGLRRVVRTRDLLARWSDARFVIVGRDRGGPEALDGFARRVRAGATPRVVLGGTTVEPAIEVVVERRAPGVSIDDVLRSLEARRSSGSGGSVPSVVGSAGRPGSDAVPSRR